jgi:hypothetical protein
MNKPMSRKEFLRYLGVFLLGVVGINSVVHMLLQSHPQTRKLTEAKVGRGFGGGKYGA